MKIAGTVALVTGGAQGIGKAIGRALLSKGGKVCLADCSDSGQETADTFNQQFGQQSAIFVKCDVRNLQDVEDAFQKTRKTFGRVDIVANNAGIVGESDYQKTVDINLTGMMRVFQTALGHMDVSKGGSGGVIIITSSTSALDTGPYTPTYTATKHALVAYTRCFGTDFHHSKSGVRTNCICPGSVNTSMADCWNENTTYDPITCKARTASRKLIEPEEVASVFTSLVEDDSKCGEIVNIFNEKAPSKES